MTIEEIAEITKGITPGMAFRELKLTPKEVVIYCNEMYACGSIEELCSALIAFGVSVGLLYERSVREKLRKPLPL